MPISNIRENGETIGALPDGEMLFHHDMIYARVAAQRRPCSIHVEVPSHGGNTLFAPRLRGLRALEPALKAKLEGRRALHHYIYGSTQRGDKRGVGATTEAAHPVSAPTMRPAARQSTSTG